MSSRITLILARPFINTRHHINAWYDIDSVVNHTRYILRVFVHHPCRCRYPIPVERIIYSFQTSYFKQLQFEIQNTAHVVLKEKENTVFLIYTVDGTLRIGMQASRNRFSARSCLAHDVCDVSRAPRNSPTVQLVWNIRKVRRKSVH